METAERFRVHFAGSDAIGEEGTSRASAACLPARVITRVGKCRARAGFRRRARRVGLTRRMREQTPHSAASASFPQALLFMLRGSPWGVHRAAARLLGQICSQSPRFFVRHRTRWGSGGHRWSDVGPVVPASLSKSVVASAAEVGPMFAGFGLHSARPILGMEVAELGREGAAAFATLCPTSTNSAKFEGPSGRFGGPRASGPSQERGSSRMSPRSGPSRLGFWVNIDVAPDLGGRPPHEPRRRLHQCVSSSEP